MSKKNQVTLKRFSGKESSRLKLICFPYAGGSAGVFRNWADNFPEKISVYGVNLPGREENIGNSCLDDLIEIAENVSNSLENEDGDSSVFFGHSMGALVAWATARELRRRKQPLPLQLFVSGMNAPSVPRDKFSHLGDDEFIQKLLEMSEGSPEVADKINIIKEEPELVEIMIPVVRSDIHAVDTYRYTDETPLACPIFSFYGSVDSQTTPEGIAAWRKETQCSFGMQEFNGGHFFLHDREQEVIDKIKNIFSKEGVFT
ncbi:thioesterase II family protein [Acetobacter sp.]|jgi:surfactin synthase thioesterase subunit|uniref:thioesterase II family protein n=1 Tax=Acetobacter sp. TaxID=440 RepID=UPI0025BB9410|nr:thioesterase domain-containing protein [Acetobacter sp.]MCH4092495.1 thioesterase domain-containing protein [Acetobacter sp.]MCI1299629.1 thioesterase domain-containing protein [Acetobacter sp.]MCI1315491.1 thioesterase domain-containing protein [Acetobacter sp.]